MRHILHCSRSRQDARRALAAARDDGLFVNFAEMTAVLQNLDIKIMFCVFEYPSDAEQVRGLELAGVIGLWTAEPTCRDHITARIRP